MVQGSVTQITFTDRSLDTMQITGRDSVQTDERGVYVTRTNYKGESVTSFYPWTSVFSLTYA